MNISCTTFQITLLLDADVASIKLWRSWLLFIVMIRGNGDRFKIPVWCNTGNNPVAFLTYCRFLITFHSFVPSVFELSCFYIFSYVNTFTKNVSSFYSAKRHLSFVGIANKIVSFTVSALLYVLYFASACNVFSRPRETVSM